MGRISRRMAGSRDQNHRPPAMQQAPEQHVVQPVGRRHHIGVEREQFLRHPIQERWVEMHEAVTEMNFGIASSIGKVVLPA